MSRRTIPSSIAFDCQVCGAHVRVSEPFAWHGGERLCADCVDKTFARADEHVRELRAGSGIPSWLGDDAYGIACRDYAAQQRALDEPFHLATRDRALAARSAAAVVPSANRGLKGSGQGGALPDEGQALAIIDFLTFTAPWARMVEGLGTASPSIRASAVAGDVGAQAAVAEWLVDEAFYDSGLRVDTEARGFRNFYDRHFRIMTPQGKQCGFVAMGGERQKGTICVELTGAGCAHVKAWARVSAVLDTFEARITRVDIAHDDFVGAHTVDDAIRWHAAGLFNTNGRPPALQEMGWNDGSGRTVYVGKNTGNQQLCVYEKGRQQGARDGDPLASWVRWEGRFGAKYRTIPTSILCDPAPYLIGHFPPLRGWLQAVAMRMQTSAARAAANLASAVRFAKRQCGALFNLVKKHVSEPEEFAGWMLKNVVRDRFPAWLTENPFGEQTIKFAFQT